MARQIKDLGRIRYIIRWLGVTALSSILCLLAQKLPAEQKGQPLTLEETIQMALERNLEIQLAKEEVSFAQEQNKEARTGFFPKLITEYSYRRPSETTITFGGGTLDNEDRNQYRFTGTVQQPLFTGFETLSTYQLASMGLDVAEIQLERVRLDLILQVKEAYLEIVRAVRIREVAEQSVKQLEEGLRVAENFVKVGLRAKVDVLDAQTRLGQAELQLIRAINDIGVAKARLNTILREPIDTPFEVEDILSTEPYQRSYKATQEIALQQRPELREARKNVAMAEKEITLAQSDYYPDITLSANYFRRGDEPDVDGSDFVDREDWDIVAGATWTLFEWGKTRYATNQRRVRLRQAKETLEQVKDRIMLEVKTGYLTLQAAGKGINVAEKQVASAEENFRISQERYKEQVATATEVLDAQTRLTEARANYTDALVVFALARANLIRAMGLEEEPG